MEQALAGAPDAAPAGLRHPVGGAGTRRRQGALSPTAASPLVALFTEARFSTHVMTEQHRQSAEQALRSVLVEAARAAGARKREPRMTRILAGGFIGVLVAEVVGVGRPAGSGRCRPPDWRWHCSLSSCGATSPGSGVRKDVEPKHDPALDSLYRWKSQTESMIQWADSTRGEWDGTCGPHWPATSCRPPARRNPPRSLPRAGCSSARTCGSGWTRRTSPPPGATIPPGTATLDTILERLEQA